MVRLENILKISLQDVLKMSWRHLEDVLKTPWRGLEGVLKTSWRRLKDIWPRQIYWSWPRRLEDVFWRRKAKTNIFVLIKTSSRHLLKTKTKGVFKTSSRCLYQDECLLGGLFWQFLESIHEFFIEFDALIYLFLRESNKQKRGAEIIPNFTKGDLFHFI